MSSTAQDTCEEYLMKIKALIYHFVFSVEWFQISFSFLLKSLSNHHSNANNNDNARKQLFEWGKITM